MRNQQSRHFFTLICLVAAVTGERRRLGNGRANIFARFDFLKQDSTVGSTLNDGDTTRSQFLPQTSNSPSDIPSDVPSDQPSLVPTQPQLVTEMNSTASLELNEPNSIDLKTSVLDEGRNETRQETNSSELNEQNTIDLKTSALDEGSNETRQEMPQRKRQPKRKRKGKGKGKGRSHSSTVSPKSNHTTNHTYSSDEEHHASSKLEPSKSELKVSKKAGKKNKKKRKGYSEKKIDHTREKTTKQPGPTASPVPTTEEVPTRSPITLGRLPPVPAIMVPTEESAESPTSDVGFAPPTQDIVDTPFPTETGNQTSITNGNSTDATNSSNSTGAEEVPSTGMDDETTVPAPEDQMESPENEDVLTITPMDADTLSDTVEEAIGSGSNGETTVESEENKGDTLTIVPVDADILSDTPEEVGHYDSAPTHLPTSSPTVEKSAAPRTIEVVVIEHMLTIQYYLNSEDWISPEHFTDAELTTCGFLNSYFHRYFEDKNLVTFERVDCISISSSQEEGMAKLGIAIEVGFSEGVHLISKTQLYDLIVEAMTSHSRIDLVSDLQDLGDANPFSSVSDIELSGVITAGGKVGGTNSLVDNGLNGLEEDNDASSSGSSGGLVAAMVVLTAISVCGSMGIFYVRNSREKLIRKTRNQMITSIASGGQDDTSNSSSSFLTSSKSSSTSSKNLSRISRAFEKASRSSKSRSSVGSSSKSSSLSGWSITSRVSPASSTSGASASNSEGTSSTGSSRRRYSNIFHPSKRWPSGEAEEEQFDPEDGYDEEEENEIIFEEDECNEEDSDEVSESDSLFSKSFNEAPYQDDSPFRVHV